MTMYNSRLEGRQDKVEGPMERPFVKKLSHRYSRESLEEFYKRKTRGPCDSSTSLGSLEDFYKELTTEIRLGEQPAPHAEARLIFDAPQRQPRKKK
jgi:hypothetical protein